MISRFRDLKTRRGHIYIPIVIPQASHWEQDKNSTSQVPGSPRAPRGGGVGEERAEQ